MQSLRRTIPWLFQRSPFASVSLLTSVAGHNNKMATLDEVAGGDLGTLSPTDLEILDIFNVSHHQLPKEDKPCSTTTMTFQRSFDKELLDATMTVLKTGKLTPLIKEELKCTIQNRRLARGQEELMVDLTPSTHSHTLSPEEEASLDEKRKIRRERNRVAALKCRKKKREEQASLVEHCQMLEARNSELQQQLQQMEQEKNTILQALAEVRGLQLDVGGAFWSELMGGASNERGNVGGAMDLDVPHDEPLTDTGLCGTPVSP
ncbi:uncharacterized protein LOC135466957 [Liolophura sinensis]|uniref:uncharacterized protein LOC135466957 n=1 Tax=Liolophura sinensis TaxID=3198878 RepID=UPI0031598BAE